MIERILKVFGQNQNPRLAILMSGQGSNARSLLLQKDRYPNLKFVAIVTDNPNNNAEKLAAEFGLKWRCFVKGKENRENFFKEIACYLEDLQIEALIYSGFMKITPPFFVNQFPGLNIHPADLTVTDGDGIPRYRGINVIRQAIENGEPYVASTVHVVEDRVDCGTPIAVSKRLMLSQYPNLSHKEIHEKLKSECEHALFPDTLEMLSKKNLTIQDLPFVHDSVD